MLQCQDCKKWWDRKDTEIFIPFDKEAYSNECPACGCTDLYDKEEMREMYEARENAKDNQLTSPSDNIDRFGFKKHIPNDKRYDEHGNCINQIQEF